MQNTAHPTPLSCATPAVIQNKGQDGQVHVCHLVSLHYTTALLKLVSLLASLDPVVAW